ncbi:hypothetical protein SELMODRAFT_123024, partial [Selaginella moellendorffii]
NTPRALVLPLHGRLCQEDQQLVFEAAPPGTGKMVFATNIAETSLTMPGIRYFKVRGGLSKQAIFDPQTGMTTLELTPISQSRDSKSWSCRAHSFWCLLQIVQR